MLDDLIIFAAYGYLLIGLAIAPNGITLMTDHLGRTEREGFVQFDSPDVIPKALEKHREKIQHR